MQHFVQRLQRLCPLTVAAFLLLAACAPAPINVPSKDYASCATAEPSGSAEVIHGFRTNNPQLVLNAYAAESRPTMVDVVKDVSVWQQMTDYGLQWMASCVGDSGDVWTFYIFHTAENGEPRDTWFVVSTDAHGMVTSIH